MLLILYCLACALGETLLHQTDFNDGTYRITQPGRYVLAEDIHFSPNEAASAYDSGWLRSEQLESNGGSYGDSEYALGFFAAVTIETHDVELDLNGHRLEQSVGHALLQRFHALVELANTPFIVGQGPHSFTNTVRAARNVFVHNGVLGRSSHHGIHGNNNRQVRIRNIEFVDFEVAAVSLNGVDGLIMQDCQITNRKDIPVLGIFSAARFLQRYVDFLYARNSSVTLAVQTSVLSVSDVRSALVDAINAVHGDVVAQGSIDAETHPDEHALFSNPSGLIDGNAYGVLLNKVGVAVNDFPSQPKPPYSEHSASGALLKNILVTNLLTEIREVVGVRHCSAISSDSVGAILQLLNTHDGQMLTISSEDESEAEYTGNVVANAQLLVAKAIHSGEFVDSALDTSRNSIRCEVVAWAEAGGTAAPEAKLSNLLEYGGWQCNGDSMAHVQKGAVGFKIDGVVQTTVEDCHVSVLENRGAAGSPRCGPYDISHPAATQVGYNGAHARGMSFAGDEDVLVHFCSVSGVRSYNGDAYGYDVFTDSTNVDFDQNDAFLITADHGNAVGFHLDRNTGFSDIERYCSLLVRAPNGHSYAVWNEQGCQNIVGDENC